MKTHIYAFGSICRGDVQYGSDIDLLALVDRPTCNFDSTKFSIYSHNRISELWNEGNPFAWHLHHESRLIFSSDDEDYIKNLKAPNPYTNCHMDCKKFNDLILEASESLNMSRTTCTFDLSTIFLGMRNIATCFALGYLNRPIFARNSALNIGTYSINIDISAYKALERARILCTRGYGDKLSSFEIAKALDSLVSIQEWAKATVSMSEGI